MIKVAQYTNFDKLVQEDHAYKAKPQQRLLFPEKPEYSYSDAYKEEDVEEPEKEPEEVNLKYPEIEPGHIRTNVPFVPFPGTEKDEGPPTSEEAHDTETANRQSNDKARNDIFAKYNQLRKAAAIFYAHYQEANQLASSDDYQLDLSGTYADLFANYGKLVTHKLTQEIGRLFGHRGARRQHYSSIQRYLDNGINIFNITSENYEEKRHELIWLTNYMNDVSKNYEHRVKLLKKLGPNIQAEADKLLQKPEALKFFAWMDEYFPNYKQDIVNSTISTLSSHSYSRSSSRIIIFSDLVNFKTYKSIYEKAQHTATYTLQDAIQYNVMRDVKTAIHGELYKKISHIFISLAQYMSDGGFVAVPRPTLSRDLNVFAIPNGLVEAQPPTNSSSAEEQCNQIISFLRKSLNIDIRSIFTFAVSASKKNLLAFYASGPTFVGEDEKRIIEYKSNVASRMAVDIDLIYSKFIKNLRELIHHFLEKKIDDTWVSRWGFKSAVEELVTKVVGTDYRIDTEKYSKFLKMNARDFEQIAIQFIFKYIMKSIVGLNESEFNYQHGSQDLVVKQPGFGGIGKVVTESSGKFSIEAFVNFASQHIPFVSKEILLALIKAMFRELDYKSLNQVALLSQKDLKNTIQAIVYILQKDNKLNHDNLYKIFKKINTYTAIYRELRSNFPNVFNDEELLKTIAGSVRNHQTIDQDLTNLVVFAKFVHNEAGSLSDKIIIKIIRNKNFINFNKSGIVKKLFKSYTSIQNEGGAKGIYSKYGKIIATLRQRKYISETFRENIFLITKFFESNDDISPASPVFGKLFEVASQIESDLSILEMGDALKDLLKGYKIKSPKLFDLDYSLRNDLRFRVLKDKDPRILRIGIETDCCQRLGGFGEIAARDSFMNPLSSVVILEWKDPSDNEWKLLTQSYFHYVPEDNGYILDNIEHNKNNVPLFKATNTDLSLEEVYATYAVEIKNKFDVAYFLAGKGYSKISAYQFQTDRRKEDPRFLDDRALTKYKRDHYSDYDEENSMDLLNPTFNIDAAKNKVLVEEVKKAHLQMRRFIKSILNANKFIKVSQITDPKPATQPDAPIQDIKTLSGVKTNIFGPQSWLFINQYMNELNSGLFELGQGQKLGNQTINFQTVVKNPTGITRFTGGLKALFKLSIKLWGIVTTDKPEPYTVDDSKNIIAELINDMNSSDFPEPEAQDIKPQLINILNKWSAIL